MSWPVVPLGEVARIQGGIQKQPKRTPRENSYPFLRVANVTAKGLSLEEVHSIELFGDELSRYGLERGDLLVVEGNGSASQIGRAAVWDGSIPDAVHQNHLIRVRPSERLNPRFLSYMWNSPVVREELSRMASSTSGLLTLSVSKLKLVAVPLPPLDEQRRIVDMLEAHLSRLDAARRYLEAAVHRLDKFVTSTLLTLIPAVEEYPCRWETTCVENAGSIELGRQRHPDWHNGPNMRPYLRVANVFEDRIDTSDVKFMHWSGATFDRFKLRAGDILLNEGQTPDLLGRPAIYRGDPPDVAFTNSLLRFVPCERVLPEFALLVFRRHMRAGRFKRESRITTNIAHLSASRLKPIEFPIPSIEEQRSLIRAAETSFESERRMHVEVSNALRRTERTRAALLGAAFSGH